MYLLLSNPFPVPIQKDIIRHWLFPSYFFSFLVPPEWLIQPKDTRTLLGSPASIDCSVRGSPTPQVIWKRLVGKNNAVQLFDTSSRTSSFDTSGSSGSSSVTIGISSSNSNQSLHLTNPTINNSPSGHLIGVDGSGKSGLQQYHMIRSGPDHQVYENGTLRISRSSIEDRGDYLCAASNGIGPGISKVVHFTVNGNFIHTAILLSRISLYRVLVPRTLFFSHRVLDLRFLTRHITFPSLFRSLLRKLYVS